MTRILPLASFLLLAGCGQEQSAAPSNDTAQAAPEPAAKAPVPSLEGEWRVAAITGAPTTGTAMTASLGSGRASISAGCLRRGWIYKQDRNLVAFTGAPGGSSNCGRSPSAEEETAFSAVGDANLAIFAKDGSEATLSGTGGTLTLERR